MLLIIGYAGQTVFSPPVRARAGLIVGEVIPRITTLAIVLTYRSPLPFTELGTPLFPGDFLLTGFFKSVLFGIHATPRSSGNGFKFVFLRRRGFIGLPGIMKFEDGESNCNL